MTKKMCSAIKAGDDFILAERRIAWETVCNHKVQHPEYYIDAPERAAEFLEDVLADSPVELLFAIALDSSNRFLGCTRLSSGSVNRAVIYPRLLVSFLLETNATGCILVHGHPSGTLTFSFEDHALTRSVSELLTPLDVTLLDHLLCVPARGDTPAEWVSMRQQGEQF